MKRLLLFLLLLTAGFVALHFAAGDDPTANAGAAPSQPRPPQTTPLPATAPVQVQTQQGKPGLVATISGKLRIAQVRLVPDGSGASRKVPVYELTCDDTVPQEDGTYELQHVRVKLFDAGAHAADLIAAKAIVALQDDANGQRSIREDKEIELFDAKFDSIPGARLGQLHLELGRVRAHIGDDEVTLHTPDEREPVLIRIDGERAATLRGRGLQARLPKDNGAALGRLDFVLQREPELLADGITVRAQGSLHYVEALASGSALLTIEQQVVIELDSVPSSIGTAPVGTAPGHMQMTGDLLTLWLQRAHRNGNDDGASKGRIGEHDAIAWQHVQLAGSPAHVDGAGIDLRSPKLSALPGPRGKPWLLTAHGGASELHQRDAHGTATFRSSRPIRLVRPRDSIGATYAQFGFPQWSLRPLADLQLLLFDGDSQLDAGDGVQLQADRGLQVYQLQPGVDGGAVLAVGRGNVRIEQGTGAEHTVATGDQGFLLQRGPGGDSLRLGIDDAASAQHFGLQRGQLQLHGTGACRIERGPDGAGAVHLASTARTIAGEFGAALGSLQDAAFLDVEFGGGGDVRSLHTGGAPSHFTFARGGRRVDAYAADLLQIARASWRLHGVDGAPARLVAPAHGKQPGGQLTAPVLEVHQLGADAVLLDAQADDTASAHLVTDLDTGEHVDVRSRRLRLLPFALPTAARRMHFAGIPIALQSSFDHVLGRGWLRGDGDVTADFTDREGAHTHATGTQLLLSQGAQAGLLRGDTATAQPATLDHRDIDERRTLATGAQVQFRNGGQALTVLSTFPGSSTLVPPSVVFRDARKDGGPLANLRAECRGEIEVLPEIVLFHGPVTAHSLLPDGTEDPRGMQVEAKHLNIERSRADGKPVRVDASGGVRVDWKDLTAQSEQVEIDLKNDRVTATDPVAATLTSRGRQFRARCIQANYVTYTVTTWQGGVGQEPAVTRR